MIEGLYSALERPTAEINSGPAKVLRMVKNERMGGFVPKWETPKTSETFSENIEKSLSSALDNANPASSENALSYHAAQTAPETTAHTPKQEFGFGDLIDMVNPLHHLPVVGHVYRELTGDEIKPIGQIMGGALFGGPLGAASGLINVVIQQETGKDMAGNAFAIVLNGEAPTYRSQTPPPNSAPEVRLAAAQKSAENPIQNTSPQTQNDMPGNLLAFVDMRAKTEIVIERAPAATGRTAGSFARTTYPTLDQNPLPRREPITQVRLSQNFND